MKYYLYIFIVFTLVACQIEDKNAPAPDEAYIKYYGELTTHEASDIEIVYDDNGEPEGFVVFGTQLSENGDRDFFVLRTNLDGVIEESVSFGFADTLDILDSEGNLIDGGDGMPDDWTRDGNVDTIRAEETGGQIHFVSDFGDGTSGYAIIGTSSITINAIGISDWKWMSYSFLNRNLQPILVNNRPINYLRDRSDDEFLDFVGNDIIQLNTRGFLMVGGREEDRGGGDSDFDNLFVRLNLTDGIVFEQTQGIPGDDEEDILKRAFQKANGNLVMIGNSNTPSFRGESGGINGTNVFYLETDINGTPSNSAAYGLADARPDGQGGVYNEIVSDVIKTPTGYCVVGTSNTSFNEQFAFIMNLSNSGVYLNGSNHQFSTYNPDNNTLQSLGNGVTQTVGNNLVMLGEYLSFNTGSLSRGGEGMFVKFNQGSVPINGAESYFGLADGNDAIVDAVTLPDGKIVAVANVDFGGGVKLLSIIKLNDDGSLD
ncbi:hypothetical protein [Ekhidna sp.]|uniref:hypothetical protein n=1 Tax=Ekhidna sp. TaxID=2608089 RepID=UPI003CCC1220